MGDPKFYKTPVGRVRAKLLLSSGVQYASGTAQMRLLVEHSSAEDARAATGILTLFDRLSDIAIISGASVFPNDEARNSYRNNISVVCGRLVALLTGIEPEPQPEDRQRKPATDQQLVNYVEQFKGGFSDMRSLVEAVNELDRRIAQNG